MFVTDIHNDIMFVTDIYDIMFVNEIDIMFVTDIHNTSWWQNFFENSRLKKFIFGFEIWIRIFGFFDTKNFGIVYMGLWKLFKLWKFNSDQWSF